MLHEIQVVGLTEFFDDSVVLLSLELGWDPAVLAFADEEKKRVSTRKSSLTDFHTNSVQPNTRQFVDTAVVLSGRIDMANMPNHIRHNVTSHPTFQREQLLYLYGVNAFWQRRALWCVLRNRAVAKLIRVVVTC